MQTGTRGRHWLLGTSLGKGSDKGKTRQMGRESKFGRVCGGREDGENIRRRKKTENEGIKGELHLVLGSEK